MDTLLFYFELGLNHVLDPKGLDHFYFLLVLTIPFAFYQWRSLLILVSLFTLGHTLSLWVAYEQWVQLPDAWVEFLIPLTILATCVPILIAKNPQQTTMKSPQRTGSLTFIFGLIHGLGFARYFKQIVLEEDAYTGLFSFAIGVETAQLIIVVLVMVVSFMFTNLIKVSVKKWLLIVSAMVAALALQMSLTNWPY
jgi:hypothetical protein